MKSSRDVYRQKRDMYRLKRNVYRQKRDVYESILLVMSIYYLYAQKEKHDEKVLN